MEATKIEFDQMKKNSFHDEHHKPDAILATRFHFPWNKTSWFGMTDYIDVPARESEDNVIYTFSSTDDHHLLSSTKLNVELPEIITSSDQVRVAWIKDIFIHLIKEATLVQNNQVISKITSESLDIYHNFFESDSVRSLEKEARGDVPELTEFTHRLPRYSLEISQPWFYNQSSCNSHPLLYNDKQELTSHVYNFRRNFSELLRVQIRTLLKDSEGNEKETWKDVKFSDQYISFLKEFRIPNPKLSAVYCHLSNFEKESYTSNCPGSEEHKVIRFKEFIPLNLNDRATVGDKFSLVVKTKTPNHCIFWFAEDRDFAKNNNYGNYTFDPEDPENGECPIIEYCLTYNGDVKSKGDSKHRCITQVRRHFVNKPKKNGFGVFSHSWYPATEAQADLSMFYGNTTVKLDLEVADKDTKKIFYIKVYALVMKKITIDVKDGKGVFLVDHYPDGMELVKI